MCSAGCGRLRIDGRAVRGDRECCPKRRDNVGGPVPESIAPLPPGLPVVPGVRRARDQPWWMGRPILVSVLSFFLLSPEERSRCADYSRTYHHRILPQVGAVLDVPAGERLFVRATMRLFISL